MEDNIRTGLRIDHGKISGFESPGAAAEDIYFKLRLEAILTAREAYVAENLLCLTLNRPPKNTELHFSIMNTQLLDLIREYEKARGIREGFTIKAPDLFALRGRLLKAVAEIDKEESNRIPYATLEDIKRISIEFDKIERDARAAIGGPGDGTPRIVSAANLEDAINRLSESVLKLESPKGEYIK
jgi:hypothetical protein